MRAFSWGRKMPLPNILEFIGTNITQRKFQEAQEELLNYLGIEVPTKTELNSEISKLNNAITPKADKIYVDSALSSFQNGALKTYPTLAAANADIANITLNTKVEVLSATEGGSYYKATAGATSLTKSPYDAVEQAKVDATSKANAAEANAKNYANITAASAINTVLHVNTDTTQPNEVLIADSRGNAALAYDPISKKLIGNFETKVKYLAKLVNHFLFYGQSLSVGAEGLPVISTVARYTNKTFVGGPRGANNFASLKLLVEDNTTAPDGLSNRGETPCSGAANAASLFAWKENGINPDDFSILCSTAGKGGTRIDLLDQGEDWYNNQFLSHIWNGYKLSGGNYGLPCVAWLQGESDLDAATPITYAEYKSKLVQLREDTQNYVFSLCGQRYPITFLTYQLSYKIKTSDAVARSQFDLDKENENFGLVVPTYMFPHYSDQVHLTNVGYKWIGAYFGRAFKQVVFDGIKPKGIRPISAYKDGLMIKVKLKAPQLPLKFDTTTLKATTNQGFSVHDDTGVVSVASVAVVDDTVTITLSAETTGSVTVKYAYEYAATGLGINGGASGNLIDSTTDSVVINSVEKPMFYVCPHFAMSVKKLEI